MTLIIPGVEVSVVKDVVPQQLAPSGVLGIVGLTEPARPGTRVVQRASSWSRFRDRFGPGTAYSIPEARQALDNGVNELVIARIESSSSAAAFVAVPMAGGLGTAFTIRARAAGTWANDLKVKITSRGKGATTSFDLEIQRPGGSAKEIFRQLTIAPGSGQYVVDVLGNTAISTVASASSAVTIKTETQERLRGVNGKLPVIVTDDGARVVASLVSKSEGPELQVTITEQKLTLEAKDQAAAGFARIGDDIDLAALRRPGAESAAIRAIRALLDGQRERNFELEVAPGAWPADGEYALAGGADASADDYSDALRALENEPDVDMVLAAVQDFSDVGRVTQIYSAVIGHCNAMSIQAKGRIGLGQTPPLSDNDRDMEARVGIALQLVSDRFVLVAPFGVVGAVAGMIGSLQYFHSPTFKRVAGLGALETPLGIDEQRALLKGNVVPVAVESSKGLVVLRGLTTDGDQISVRRVADHAVRGVKMLGDLFIGTLNNEDGRNALKQKLSEFLLQMQKEGAIVPSTDGSDPAFKVNVYSSQDDFALGVVRVDVAVRPVRAIDYIYATILIQT